MYKAFPCSDYYGGSVTIPNPYNWHFGLGNPRLDTQ